MDYITRLCERLFPAIEKDVQEEIEGGPPQDITEMEQRARQLAQRIAVSCLQAWLEEMEGPYVASEVSCPCGGKAHYVRRRPGVLLTIVGRVHFQRAYYLCPVCHRGQYPLDERLGYEGGCLTPQLTSLVGQVGAEIPFERGQVLLEKVSGLRLSENTIRQATQRVGAEVMGVEKGWQEESQDEEVLREHDLLPATAKPCRLYGSLDGVIVPVEGEWRELKTGCWYREEASGDSPKQEGEQERHATEISYYCDFLEAEAFGALLWATGCQRLADQAEELVFVADGAAWIWNLVVEHFPKAVQIVDWYHATTYIAAVAQAAFGEGNAENQAWQEQVRSDLWEGRFDLVLAAFEEQRSHRQAGEAVRKALTYYTNNRERMRYAEFRAKGYRIGSGTVESGCKQIGTQRLKVAGARWGEEGARKTAKARAALLSGQWDTVASRLKPLPLAA